MFKLPTKTELKHTYSATCCMSQLVLSAHPSAGGSGRVWGRDYVHRKMWGTAMNSKPIQRPPHTQFTAYTDSILTVSSRQIVSDILWASCWSRHLILLRIASTQFATSCPAPCGQKSSMLESPSHDTTSKPFNLQCRFHIHHTSIHVCT